MKISEDSLAYILSAQSELRGYRSELTNSTPLSVITTIYLKATRDCYLDHNEGAKALIRWLTLDQDPIAIPDNLPPIPKPKFLWNYYLDSLTNDITDSIPVRAYPNRLFAFQHVAKGIFNLLITDYLRHCK